MIQTFVNVADKRTGMGSKSHNGAASRLIIGLNHD